MNWFMTKESSICRGGKDNLFSNSAGESGLTHTKNEAEPLTLYTDHLQMDERLKRKTWNHKTPGRKCGE